MKKFIPLIILLLSITYANEYVEQLKDARQKVTNNYLDFLKSVDNYLSNDYTEYYGHNDYDNTIYKKNKLLAILSLKAVEYEGFKPSLYLKTKIILPKTKDKIELTLDKFTDDTTDNKNIDDDFDNNMRDSKINIGLSYYLKKSENFNIYAKLGARLHPPFNIYGRLNAKKNIFLNNTRLTLEQNIYYYIHKQGFIPSVSINIIYPVKNDKFILQEKHQLIWREKQDEIELENFLRLHQVVNNKNRFAYTLSYSAINDDECSFCTHYYSFDIKYHRKITDWFFIDTIPQIGWKRENNFHSAYSFIFNIGMLFGR